MHFAEGGGSLTHCRCCPNTRAGVLQWGRGRHGRAAGTHLHHRALGVHLAHREGASDNVAAREESLDLQGVHPSRAADWSLSIIPGLIGKG